MDKVDSSPNWLKPRWVLTTGLFLALVISVRAVLRGGYIGPDYPEHLGRIIQWPKIFDFSTTNPPVYYFLGHYLFLLVGPTNAFPITLSLIQVAINLFALWHFFRYVEPLFNSKAIYLACCVFLIFLPARIIHAATIGTDSMTVPLFVWLLILIDPLRETVSFGRATAVGLVLGLAVWVKYSFMALMPVLFVIFLFIRGRGRGKLVQAAAICVLSLALPCLLALHSFWASSHVHGYNTEKHWVKGVPADMSYPELFLVKANDLKLFGAPEIVKTSVTLPHYHSYLGLSHMAVFTDPFNLFQKLSVPQVLGKVLIPNQKTRSPWKTPVMRLSMLIGVLWTITALVGTAWLLFCAIAGLFKARIEREHIILLCGVGLFLIIFLPIPFVHGGALFGYWMPRLILPALLSFFLAAFLFVDRKIAARSATIAQLVLCLVMIQVLVEVVMLL